MEHEGIGRLRALLLKFPLDPRPARYAELHWNLTGEGFHTQREIAEQMRIPSGLARVYQEEAETHIRHVLGENVYEDHNGVP